MPGCTGFSNPLLQNNLIWQNRTFYIGIGNLGQGSLNQQKLVSLFDAFTGAAAPVQTASGQCTSGVSYWDIGIRGDTGPTNHNSGFILSPKYSVLDDPTDYPGAFNLGSNPSIVSQYCNGSRVPPTCTVADGCGGPSGYGVPPGIVDASSPNPVFSLTPAATVDEGNNWINVSWGPLSVTDDAVAGGQYGNYGGGPLFANYALAPGSPAIDYIPTTGGTFNTAAYPTLATDFFGNSRPDPTITNRIDVGAIEYQGTTLAPVITVQPTNQTVTLGNTATFSVTATAGGAPLTYVWQYSTNGGTTWHNWAVGTGFNTATYTTIATTAAYNGLLFEVVVTANGFSTTSNVVTLTVNSPPVITLQPTNKTVALGATATFTVTATGTAPLTYAWQYSTNGGTTWHNWAVGTGFNTATYTTIATTATYNQLLFRVVVTAGNGLFTNSNAVTLTVTGVPPAITLQPASQTVALGTTATFNVTATGTPTLTYAWQYSNNGGTTWHNWAVGTGYNTANYTTIATTAAYNGLLFRVVVTDGNGLITNSATATLTVH
jgi:hypothetical protein